MRDVIALVDAAGDRLCKAATRMGGRIDFDAVIALARDTPSPLGAPGLWSPNGQCRLVATADGWIAVNLARDDDRQAVPAWLQSPLGEDPWEAVVARARTRSAQGLLERAILLHLPVALVGERRSGPSVSSLRPAARRRRAALNVVDLSALWAGPYCAALLAESGIAVDRFESRTRPDPTPAASPRLHARLNCRKRQRTISWSGPDLRARIAGADILVTSARPHALARLGLSPDILFADNPDLLWVAITAHGWSGDAAMRVGFGDDCAAAGGLVDWQDGAPHFIGDALADPLTGIEAAIQALTALSEHKAGLIDVSLAATAAAYADRRRLCR